MKHRNYSGKMLFLAILAGMALLAAGCRMNRSQQPSTQTQPTGETQQEAGETETIQNEAIQNETVQNETAQNETARDVAIQDGETQNEVLTMEKAKEIAIAYLGIDEADIVYTEYELDNGRYEFKFRLKDVEYDIDVDSRTGVVSDVDKDLEEPLP